MSKLEVHPVSAPGWSEFLVSRKDLLDRYDNAREKARNNPLQTAHGTFGEAALREWLAAFLPERFGVTAGRIVSSRGPHIPLPHYDVVIYDRLESEVLWLDTDPDRSTQGRVRAIPVEHVLAVLEVKAALTRDSMAEALSKLAELRPFLGYPEPEPRYPRFLPGRFSCGVVFFEDRISDGPKFKHLARLVPDEPLRGYFGGIALRTEGIDPKESGVFSLLSAREPLTSSPSELWDRRERRGNSITGWKSWGPDEHLGLHFNYSLSNFARFAHDLVARMKGTYDPRFLSSWHGQVFMVAQGEEEK